MIALLFTSLAVAAPPGPRIVDPAELAPGIAELDVALTRAQVLLRETEATAVAAARVHNTLADAWAVLEAAPRAPGNRALQRCADLTTVARLAPGRIFVLHHRELTQSLRAQAERARRIADQVTVQPLLDEKKKAALIALEKGTARQVDLHFEFAAWHRRLLLPTYNACRATLGVVPGIQELVPRAQGERAREVAVVGMSGGYVCPLGAPGQDAVVVTDGMACWGTDQCDCTPAPVLPGAVLGPED